MNLENSIKDVIGKKLGDGTIEKLVAEQLEKGVLNALDSLFRSYGDVTKVIEEKVKSVMIPYLETYDYSKYIVKLDSVLLDVLKNTALDNKKILTNFKGLMTPDEKREQIKVTELFEKWMDYVAENVDISDLEVVFEDRASYENVEVTFEVEYDSDRDWSLFDWATLTFECEHDENMNFEIKLSRYKEKNNEGWTMTYKQANDLSSLRHLNEFSLFLMQLEQCNTKIIIDKSYDSNEVEPKAEPEASFS